MNQDPVDPDEKLFRSHARGHWQKKRKRAEKLGIPFDLTKEFVYKLYREAEGALCPVLSIQMRLCYGRGGSDDTPSLDRVIPEKGYVVGNVAIISQRANRLKHEASVEELRALVAYIDSYVAESEHQAALAALAAQEWLDAEYEPVDPEPLDFGDDSFGLEPPDIV